MTTTPILFKKKADEMVRAILDGQKTQTRRIVKPQPPNGAHPFFIMCSNCEEDEGKWRFTANKDHLSGTVLGPVACPYGKPGDRLWVRETWAARFEYDQCTPKEIHQGTPIWYKADVAGGAISQGGFGKWRPSAFMPRWASRILLEITAVRVERLQQISVADAMAEGIKRSQRAISPSECKSCFWDYIRNEPQYRDPGNSYASLWESINGPGSWDENPWVWVVEFKGVQHA